MNANISKTHMRREIDEIPQAIERLIANSESNFATLTTKLQHLNPAFAITIARGSSDHCATFLKYAFELYAALPVCSLGPSIASVYGKNLKLDNSFSLAISQSGKSPDIIEASRMCRRNGAYAIAFTNESACPLAHNCDYAIDIVAGHEKSIAATKTFVNSLVAGLLFLGYLTGDAQLLRAIRRLPEQCAQVMNVTWQAFLEYMTDIHSLYVLGRGPSFAIANEMALKFQETCQIHAQSYSAAEVMHGPLSIVDRGFPTLVLTNNDASKAIVRQSINALADKGVAIYSNDDILPEECQLQIPATDHPLTASIIAITCFYGFVEALARKRGNNPDLPPHVRKVTETL